MICEFIAAISSGCCCRNRTEGLTALLTHSFDLAIIEAILPGGSGISLAAVAANENIPVLLMSGHPDANLKLQAFGSRSSKSHSAWRASS